MATARSMPMNSPKRARRSRNSTKTRTGKLPRTKRVHRCRRALQETNLIANASRAVRRGREIVRRGIVRRGIVRREIVRRGIVRRGIVRRGIVRRGIVRREISPETLVMGRVQQRRVAGWSASRSPMLASRRAAKTVAEAIPKPASEARCLPSQQKADAPCTPCRRSLVEIAALCPSNLAVFAARNHCHRPRIARKETAAEIPRLFPLHIRSFRKMGRAISMGRHPVRARARPRTSAKVGA